MHRMYYPYTCEGGILTVEYTLGIDFDWESGQRGDYMNPPIPAQPEDIQLVEVSAALGEHVVYFPMDSEEFRAFEDLLDEPKFYEKIEAACCEHIADKREAARESAAEAKFQAMRDGE